MAVRVYQREGGEAFKWDLKKVYYCMDLFLKVRAR